MLVSFVLSYVRERLPSGSLLNEIYSEGLARKRTPRLEFRELPDN
jgi:hypothetical protein